MPLVINLTTRALLHAMQPHALTRCYPTIGLGITLAAPNHPLRCRQASCFASGKVTVYPSLANASPLIILTLVHPRRLPLSIGANKHDHQHHQNP